MEISVMMIYVTQIALTFRYPIQARPRGNDKPSFPRQPKPW